jgi:hypothetical protein
VVVEYFDSSLGRSGGETVELYTGQMWSFEAAWSRMEALSGSGAAANRVNTTNGAVPTLGSVAADGGCTIQVPLLLLLL